MLRNFTEPVSGWGSLRRKEMEKLTSVDSKRSSVRKRGEKKEKNEKEQSLGL